MTRGDIIPKGPKQWFCQAFFPTSHKNFDHGVPVIGDEFAMFFQQFIWLD